MARSHGSESSAAEFVPESRRLPDLAEAARHCRGCDLYKNATQTVFGAGGPKARVLFVGEQPGDSEDRQGLPFVGPAGRLLDEVLAEVGIDRSATYVTNAVKHFKWEPRGTRRLHAKPSAREVNACRPWLAAELDAIHPEVIVCLGATAAQSLMGPKFRITQERGRWLHSDWAPWLLATYHPSAILRAPDAAARESMRKDFTADMRKVARRISS